MAGTGEEDKDQHGSSPQKKTKSRSQPKTKADDAEKDDKEAAERLRKAQLESKIRKRVASEAKAFDVVNRLIEPNISTEHFLKACHLINHSHYTDVVEERAISHLCGYPVCSNTLSQVAKKKYHISTKRNTVYDITDRKKFCSNACYRASQYIEQQIPDTPVWTRRDEMETQFDLLQHKARGTFEGEEVIGSKMFPLKQEVLLLEKLDQKSSETKTAKEPRTPASLGESQHLSDQLLSLSTEEDLDNRMGSLSLHGQDQDSLEKSKPLSKAPEGSLPGAESGGKREALEQGSAGQERSSRQGACEGELGREAEKEEKGRIVEGDKEGPALESAMGHLTLQDSVQPHASDSDDSDSETQDPQVSDSCRKDGAGTEGTGLTHHTAASPKPVEASDEITGTDSEHCEVTKKPDKSYLQQQPKESKSAYLMRLLDKRKNLFSKMADIQTYPTCTPQASQSEPVHCNDEKTAASEKNRAKLSDADRMKEGSEQNAHSGTPADSRSTQGQGNVKSTSSSQTRSKHSQSSTKPSRKATPAPPQPQMSPLDSVCQIISHWIMSESLTYLGLSSAQGQGDDESQDHSADAFHKDPEMQRKYMDLCQRLAGQEKDFDDLLGEDEVEDEARKDRRKPLPRFEELKKQTEEYRSKVELFLKGPSGARKKSNKQGDGGDGDGGDDESVAEGSKRLVVLPVVDSHNQMLIRRRIVLERLDHTMPDLLLPLGLPVQYVSSELRELVFTFSFTSHNIVFKPAEWTLVAILLLRMLAIKSQVLSAAFQSDTESQAFHIVLSQLGHSSASLGKLVDQTLSQRKAQLQEMPDH